MAQLRYDVVVVGGGPAGSSAAKAVAQQGLTVLVVDRRAEIGRPVQCAEYVPRLILREVPLPASCVAFKTTVMRTHLPGGRSGALRAPGFILHRALFDKNLAVQAARAGADIMLRSSAVERTDRGVVIRRGRQVREVAAGIIIGADGAHSTVGRWIGQRNTELVAAAQRELVLDSAVEETEVYFGPQFPRGYAWLFPKGPTANVGVGVDGNSMAPAQAALDEFVEQLSAQRRVARHRAVAHTSGFIPVGGLLKGWAENVVLAGDAAGCVHPLTGAGILYAIFSGQMAGQVAVEALRMGDLGLLAQFERRLDKALGASIRRGLARRRNLIEGWTDDPGALEHLVRQNWIAFEGFHDPSGPRR